MSEFEERLKSGARQVEHLRGEAVRWRKAALTARCGLDITAGTYRFDRGMASIMSRALEENADAFDRQADETVANVKKQLGGER